MENYNLLTVKKCQENGKSEILVNITKSKLSRCIKKNDIPNDIGAVNMQIQASLKPAS